MVAPLLGIAASPVRHRLNLNIPKVQKLARRKGFEPLTPRFEVWCSIQLSYRRLQIKMARPKRFELPTPRFVVWCSIQLSYGRAPAPGQSSKNPARNA